MKTAFLIPNNTGSCLLQKLTKTSCEEFNCKIFNLLDQVKNMEHKYKMLTPTKLLQDAEYPKYGPIRLVSTLHEIYGRLLANRDWPAVASRFPQSNAAPVLLLLPVDLHHPLRHLVFLVQPSNASAVVNHTIFVSVLFLHPTTTTLTVITTSSTTTMFAKKVLLTLLGSMLNPRT